jgi:hypothetical protein
VEGKRGGGRNLLLRKELHKGQGKASLRRWRNAKEIMRNNRQKSNKNFSLK